MMLPKQVPWGGLDAHPRAAPVSGLLWPVTACIGLAVLAAADVCPEWVGNELAGLCYVGPNTGVCFVLLGAAGLALGRARHGRLLAAGAGLAALLIAACVLLQPVTGWRATSLGWQHLLNADPYALRTGQWPGSLRPPAALAFMLAGLAFLQRGLARRGRAPLMRPFGLAVAMLALPAVFDHVLGNALFAAPQSILLPAPTALGLLALGAALAGQRAGLERRGPDRSADWRMFSDGFVLFLVTSLVASLVGMGIVVRTVMPPAFADPIAIDHFHGMLRRQLWLGVGGIALVVLAGAVVLYLRSRPLVLGLVQARSHLAMLLENVPAGIITFGPDGVIALANRAAGAMFGRDPASLAGLHIAALLPHGWQQLSSSDSVRCQLAGQRSDGTVLDLEVVASCIERDPQRRRIAIVQDVGERARMEQALRQRESSLAHAQCLARLGSWELDLRSGRYSWSDETYRIFERAPGTRPLSREEVGALLHPDDRALGLHGERLDGAVDYDLVQRIVLPSGVVKVIQSRAQTEYDAGGAPLRVRGTVQDITEKAWADRQLREREQEYRALVDNVPDVVLRFDRQFRCVYMNPALAHASGLRTCLAWGRVLDPQSPACRPWVDALRQALEGGHPEAFEIAVAEEGTLFHYQVRVAPELRQGGKAATALATVRDISALRRGEAELRELSAHRERVREDERKNMAREVHDELGQALTALRLDVAMLRMQLEPASAALSTRLQQMKDAVDRTIGIVRNVTALLRPAALDVGLNAALEWLAEQYTRSTGVACTLRTGDSDVELDDAQATALFRIAQEALTNVVKHADASAVEVSLAERDDGVRLQVRDNGRGFDARAQAGHGRFGLRGMRERVDAMGGTLQVDSTPGGGACITVDLPTTTEQAAPADTL